MKDLNFSEILEDNCYPSNNTDTIDTFELKTVFYSDAINLIITTSLICSCTHLIIEKNCEY